MFTIIFYAGIILFVSIFCLILVFYVFFHDEKNLKDEDYVIVKIVNNVANVLIIIFIVLIIFSFVFYLFSHYK